MATYDSYDYGGQQQPSYDGGQQPSYDYGGYGAAAAPAAHHDVHLEVSHSAGDGRARVDRLDAAARRRALERARSRRPHAD